MRPSWVLMALKLKSKNTHKKDDLLDAFKIDFGPQQGGGALWEGGKLSGGAKALPFRSLVGVLVPLGCLLGPRWPQDPSKTPPGTDFIRF